MGRIVPLDPPEEEVVTGYEFWDDEHENVITVEAIHSGELAVITYFEQSIELTRDEACKVIRALNKVIAEHMPDDAD